MVGARQESTLMLGRGRFATVVAHGEKETLALKIIDVDDQRPPHNWKAEIAALERLRPAAHVVQMISWSANLKSMEPQVSIEMPRYAMTLEHVVYHYAKAKYPPGSGWRNVMPEPRICSIIAGIAAGIDSIHSAGIIHRDLKPENVLFGGPEAEPVLIDFGIAWVPGVSEQSEPVGDRITDVSSAEYKAPELLFGIRRYTDKVDLWALGCILGRLLGPDCMALFAPYTSDMALIAAQARALGPPSAHDCPSLAGSAAEHVRASAADSTTAAAPGATLRLSDSFRNLENREKLGDIATKLLSYEWTARPTARAVVHELQELQKNTSL